jgi:hypothetical protein
LSGLQKLLFVCVSATPYASPPPRPSIFSDYSFWAHHLANPDDRHLFAHAMASDFSVAWYVVSLKENKNYYYKGSRYIKRQENKLRL